jgi:hypothetical protein
MLDVRRLRLLRELSRLRTARRTRIAYRNGTARHPAVVAFATAIRSSADGYFRTRLRAADQLPAC